jgi:hypothetical protein
MIWSTHKRTGSSLFDLKRSSGRNKHHVAYNQVSDKKSMTSHQFSFHSAHCLLRPAVSRHKAIGIKHRLYCHSSPTRSCFRTCNMAAHSPNAHQGSSRQMCTFASKRSRSTASIIRVMFIMTKWRAPIQWTLGSSGPLST